MSNISSKNLTITKAIAEAGKSVIKHKNEELYKNGYIGLIISGIAEVTRTGFGGKSITVRSMSDNDIFGAVAVFGEWNELFSSIKAKSDCKVVYMSENDFKNLLIKKPALSLDYIRFLTDRIRFLNRRLDTFSAGTTQNKLYEYLLSQADGSGNVILKISMAELANRLKIGRTSLYRDISSLEKAKLIIRSGKKFIIK